LRSVVLEDIANQLDLAVPDLRQLEQRPDVAELIEMTSELVEMSKRMAEQTAAMDKMRTDFEDFRSRSWWWQHAAG